MAAYYNEIDRFAAAWLRELIARNLIAPGDVDERSIVDVRPDDLAPYTQCHFFAGIGVWSYALRSAGWPDDRAVWTGSCPCQPFSAAGKGEGFDDPRHLWPDWFRLIRERGPSVCFGEQVADRGGLRWLDLVHADLEAEGYAVGALDLSAAGFGAPHRRQRLYFVAESSEGGRALVGAARLHEDRQPGDDAARRGTSRGVVLTDSTGLEGREPPLDMELQGAEGSVRPAGAAGAARGLADADVSEQGRGELGLHTEGRGCDGSASVGERANGPVNGFWGDAEWIDCADGKARPVEPGTFPLAHGAPARVGRLRGYGNAIVAPQAQAFIEAYLDVRGAA